MQFCSRMLFPLTRPSPEERVHARVSFFYNYTDWFVVLAIILCA